MKQTQKKHLLNTETARLLAVSSDETQRLYKTRGGVYFLHHCMAEPEFLQLMDQYEARAWAEEHISAAEFLRLFRLPDDTMIRFCLDPEASKAIQCEAERSGKSASQIVNDLIIAYL